MFLFPFISALADAGAVIVDKIILGRRRMALHVFIPTLFLLLFLMTAILAPFLGLVETRLALKPQYIFLFILMIILAITWNVFYYQSIQKEKLYEHELIIMLAPAATIILASLLFPQNELDKRIFVPAVIAAGALFVSRLEKNHLAFDKYSLNLFLAVLLMSLEIMIINELLAIYSPVSLYALRTGFVFLFFIAYYRPRLTAISKGNLAWTALSALLGVIYMILRFYGYRNLGVVHTTLILIISPFLVYVCSSFIFNEKIKWKTVITGLIILICIAYVTYIDAIGH